MNNPSDDTPKDPESPVGINSARGQTLIVRNTLVVVLAFTSGFIDALAFLKLGVFASVQTANTVLLGLAFGSGNILQAIVSLAAIICYDQGWNKYCQIGLAKHADSAAMCPGISGSKTEIKSTQY